MIGKGIGKCFVFTHRGITVIKEVTDFMDEDIFEVKNPESFF